MDLLIKHIGPSEKGAKRGATPGAWQGPGRIGGRFPWPVSCESGSHVCYDADARKEYLGAEGVVVDPRTISPQN